MSLMKITLGCATGRSYRYLRIISTNVSPPKSEEKKTNDHVVRVKEPVTADASFGFADPVLRGVGQVLFLNSPKSGIAIIAGLAIGDPYLATLALAG